MNQRILSSTGNQLSAASHAIYNGSIDCAVQVSLTFSDIPSFDFKNMKIFLQTVRNEGFAALYKGFIPTWFRMVCHLCNEKRFYQ